MSVCGVHGAEMKFGRIQIRRGLPPPPPDGYYGARISLFPNARSFEIGGCLVDLDQKDVRRVRFCPDCRREEQVWLSGREAEDFWLP